MPGRRVAALVRVQQEHLLAPRLSDARGVLVRRDAQHGEGVRAGKNDGLPVHLQHERALVHARGRRGAVVGDVGDDEALAAVELGPPDRQSVASVTRP